LIITNRHIDDFFDLTKDEMSDLDKVLKEQKKELKKLDNEISAFNVGVNIGEDAGQSIMHCHIHLIPRRKGDVEDPRGGVRGVIPEKQKYRRK
jgi:diadenosine tetraphosphate (Ap4A) HIT family hydrolase